MRITIKSHTKYKETDAQAVSDASLCKYFDLVVMVVVVVVPEWWWSW